MLGSADKRRKQNPHDILGLLLSLHQVTCAVSKEGEKDEGPGHGGGIPGPNICAPQLSRASSNLPLPLLVLSEREDPSMQMTPQLSDPFLPLVMSLCLRMSG